ncbi:hypothetical protein CH365_14900 [Leptospira neocaledonica]|uniref:Uncharacterized protein n=1 Tax=Leptospira neocaledonica TaxID=2023192 RepID=A0A2M9ZVP3_9LEPT|nr:hypothetical protein CH365_14900 [Leptospira neocaledonica]
MFRAPHPYSGWGLVGGTRFKTSIQVFRDISSIISFDLTVTDSSKTVVFSLPTGRYEGGLVGGTRFKTSIQSPYHKTFKPTSIFPTTDFVGTPTRDKDAKGKSEVTEALA